MTAIAWTGACMALYLSGWGAVLMLEAGFRRLLPEGTGRRRRA